MTQKQTDAAFKAAMEMFRTGWPEMHEALHVLQMSPLERLTVKAGSAETQKIVTLLDELELALKPNGRESAFRTSMKRWRNADEVRATKVLPARQYVDQLKATSASPGAGAAKSAQELIERADDYHRPAAKLVADLQRNGAVRG